MMYAVLFFLFSFIPFTTQAEIVDVTSVDHMMQEMKNTNKQVFFYFFSDACSPCNRLKADSDEWGHRLSDQVKMLRVNVYRFPEFLRTYPVKGVPSMMMVDAQGQEIVSKSGTQGVMHLMSTYEKFLQTPEEITLATFMEEVRKR